VEFKFEHRELRKKSITEKSLSKGQRKERKEEGVEVDCCGTSSEFDFA